MNRTARALGMNSSTFRNPHGLPDAGQTSTARDFVRLAQALQDRFPRYYGYFGKRSFTYKGARHRNHNRLLGSVAGVDGIKTGYTRASGFNLVTNVRRDGKHLIAVVMGGKTASRRDAHMRELIAEYLPKAKRGDRSAPVVIAEAETHEPADIRLPRARPVAASVGALAYAAQPAQEDAVSIALAEAAEAEGDRTDPDEEEIDPIAVRIGVATEVAEAAAPATGSADSLARLKELALIRAGKQDIVAAPRAVRSSEPRASEAGWHIQIGAVPTEAGAHALIAKAQEKLGDKLDERRPLTQEIDHNGTTLFRARFAGFSGKEEARATCDALKKKSIACLAIPN
jgi:D-alanyl-D-alanine carboxypeptidase